MTTPASRRNSAGLARDVEIVDLLATAESVRDGGLGVTRIAELLGRDKAVISRALATLAEAGIVVRDPQQRTYRIGSRLFALAARTQEAWLTEQARSVLRSMVHTLRETTHLCVLRAGHVLTLASEPSPRMVGTASWTGTMAAAWRTPSGRVLLSDWDSSGVAEWYAVHRHAPPMPADESNERFGVLDRPTPRAHVIDDLPSLQAELDRIRRRGYATSDEELEHGVVAASAPVHGPDGSIIAALNVSAPKTRLDGRLDELGRVVAEYSSRLTSDLQGALPRPTHTGGHTDG